MGKKKKSAPQGADPQQQVQYMIDLSRETHARGNLGSAVFQAEEGLKIARQHLGYENITVRERMNGLLVHEPLCGTMPVLCEFPLLSLHSCLATWMGG